MSDPLVWSQTRGRNDLLSSDLPALGHLLQHFNEKPVQAPPPPHDLWKERSDRGKTFRDLRDGTFPQRRREAYRNAWGLGSDGDFGTPQVSIDLTRSELDLDGVIVLTELLRDGHVDSLEALTLGRSKIWDVLDEAAEAEGVDVDSEDGQGLAEEAAAACAAATYGACVRLADALMLHPSLTALRVANAPALDLRTLRGFERSPRLALPDQSLTALHGLVLASGLRANQTLTSLDLRFNARSLGPVGLGALAEAFQNGVCMNLATLNAIEVDGATSLCLGPGTCLYELVWAARRLGHPHNRHKVDTVNLRGAGLGAPGCLAAVADMATQLAPRVRLLDLHIAVGPAVLAKLRKQIFRWRTGAPPRGSRH